jgi:tryptophanyl-tRNA synthetase
LIYRAANVPVGADQGPPGSRLATARRFNHIYGREPGFEQHAEVAVKKMGKGRRSHSDLRKTTRRTATSMRCRKRARCSLNSRIFRSAIVSVCSDIWKAAAASFCRNRARC